MPQFRSPRRRLTGSARRQPRPAPELAALNPFQQLRAGRLSRRVIQLAVGLWIFGASDALMIAPGLGTVANAIVIGVAVDATLAVLPPLNGDGARLAAMAAGVVLNGLAGGLYIGAQLGPGPRDGLMTGLNRRTGVSMRLARTGVEVAVVLIGWLLGGIVGIGTVLYDLTIGPLTQAFLGWCLVALGARPAPGREPGPAPAVPSAPPQ